MRTSNRDSVPDLSVRNSSQAFATHTNQLYSNLTRSRQTCTLDPSISQDILNSFIQSINVTSRMTQRTQEEEEEQEGIAQQTRLNTWLNRWTEPDKTLNALASVIILSQLRLLGDDLSIPNSRLTSREGESWEDESVPPPPYTLPLESSYSQSPSPETNTTTHPDNESVDQHQLESRSRTSTGHYDTSQLPLSSNTSPSSWPTSANSTAPSSELDSSRIGQPELSTSFNSTSYSYELDTTPSSYLFYPNSSRPSTSFELDTTPSSSRDTRVELDSRETWPRPIPISPSSSNTDTSTDDSNHQTGRTTFSGSKQSIISRLRPYLSSDTKRFYPKTSQPTSGRLSSGNDVRRNVSLYLLCLRMRIYMVEPS